MAYVQGELGQTIEKLMNEGNLEYDNGRFDSAIALLIKAWEKLPCGKYEYDESFLIIWGILEIAIQIGNKEVMSTWVDHIFKADPERGDTGEREMWAGRVAYEAGDKIKALEYFKVADQKSMGRCFGDGDKKYRKLLKKEHLCYKKMLELVMHRKLKEE